MYPDFLCIGAQKAGTTWLHHNLSSHPQVWLPPVKELHYLDGKCPSLGKRLFGKTQMLRTARRHLARQTLHAIRTGEWTGFNWAVRYCLGRRSDEWYDSLFPRVEGKLAGEICPGYARIDAAGVKRIHKLMPDTKIIYLLRDPIGRAWSTAVMHYRKPNFGDISQYNDDAIKAHLADPKTLIHGDYMGNLASWRESYLENQIFIGFFDELTGSPGTLLRSILEFLGLDTSATAIPRDVKKKRNAGKGEPIPTQFQRFLAQLHYEQIVALNKAFQNEYTETWLLAAQNYMRGTK